MHRVFNRYFSSNTENQGSFSCQSTLVHILVTNKKQSVIDIKSSCNNNEYPFLRSCRNPKEKGMFFCVFYISLVANAFRSELPRVPAKYS